MTVVYAFRYLWGLPIIAPCKHCRVSVKVFRNARNRPFDAFYLCNAGNDKTQCNGNTGASPEAAAPFAEPERPEDMIAKRGDANLNQDEISALFAKASKT